MNYFEQELRRLAKACKGIINPTFAGRACFADLGGDNRVKLQFVTMGTHEQYEAIKVTILNRTDGDVDSLLFRFKDIWGKKFDHGYQDGVPHIWTYQGKNEWYSYRPTDADFKQLAAEVSSYLAVFTDRSLIPEKSQAKVDGKESVKKNQGGKQKPRTTKDFYKK